MRYEIAKSRHIFHSDVKNEGYFSTTENTISKFLAVGRLTNTCQWYRDSVCLDWERKILRKIYRPTYENGYWRIKMFQEIYNKFKSLDIVTVLIPGVARSKAWVCGCSRDGIVGWNPAGGMDVCLL
jgi:hypothetical protein